jgi:hypothetical protein
MVINPGGDASDKPARQFQSKLDKGRERFLAHTIEHALETGRRSPEDFIRHFPPDVIMQGLAAKPNLRAAILVLTTGLKQKIAEKKTWESAAEDLQIALNEGETDADSVVAVFDPDDRVRYLDHKRIWQFLIEGEFWNAPATDRQAHELAKDNVAFMVERALQDRLVTHREVVEGITVAELAKRLPKAELGKLIEAALTKARSSAAFTEVDLLKEMPAFVLVEYVPLPHLWSTVLEPKIAQAHDYVAAAAAPAPLIETTAEEIGATALVEPSAEEGGVAPLSQDWVEVPGSESPPPLSSDDDEISEDDFAAP